MPAQVSSMCLTACSSAVRTRTKSITNCRYTRGRHGPNRPLMPLSTLTSTPWSAPFISRLLGSSARPLFRQTALDALESLLALEWAHGLRHSYGPDGSPGTVAFLPDYAYLLRALLDAYESTESDRYLTEARRVASEMTAQLADEQSGALYDTPHDPQAMAALRRRLVPVDGNALASEALDRLGRDTYDEERHRQAGAALSASTVRD